MIIFDDGKGNVVSCTLDKHAFLIQGDAKLLVFEMAKEIERLNSTLEASCEETRQAWIVINQLNPLFKKETK